jgi:hypothetical protein
MTPYCSFAVFDPRKFSRGKETMMKYLLLLSSFLLFLKSSQAHGTEPVTNSLGMKLISIQPGTFIMG